jgi:aspartate racemase
MIEETARAAAASAGAAAGANGKIGLLGTTGTLHSKVFARALQRLGLEASLLTLWDLDDGERLEEELVMTPIFGPLREGRRAAGGIKAGDFGDPRKAEALAGPLRRAVAILAEAGARLVIMACTEIPLVLGREVVAGVPLLDPMEALAWASLEIASGRRPLP